MANVIATRNGLFGVWFISKINLFDINTTLTMLKMAIIGTRIVAIVWCFLSKWPMSVIKKLYKNPIIDATIIVIE